MISNQIINNFFQKFNYDSEKTLYVGIERESFTTRDGRILPIVPKILPLIEIDQPRFQSFGYELSACQLEMRYGPYHISEVNSGLLSATVELNDFEKQLNFSCYFADTAGQEIPLDIYPDPTGRYAKIVASLSNDILHAACYIAGTHVHIGMPNANDALRVYNNLGKHVHELIEMGDNSNGERINYYKLMSSNLEPTPHENIDSWVQHAIDNGYYDDPRKNWTLIRLSIHGTIEFRMFGSTPDISKIIHWVNTCRDLCKMYL